MSFSSHSAFLPPCNLRVPFGQHLPVPLNRRVCGRRRFGPRSQTMTGPPDGDDDRTPSISKSIGGGVGGSNRSGSGNDNSNGLVGGGGGDGGNSPTERPQLRAPLDATSLRTDSEIRRNRPPAREPRRRRRRRRGDGNEPVLEWDKMDSAPLVPGVDGWIDLSENAEKTRRIEVTKERLERSRNKVDDSMKSKLKSEVASPYEQNWILWISISIAVLAIIFKLSGGFETIPIIPVPDL